MTGCHRLFFRMRKFCGADKCAYAVMNFHHTSARSLNVRYAVFDVVFRQFLLNR